MFAPLAGARPLVQRSTVATISAPIGGWNARDPMSSMAPTDAIVLDNFIPEAGGVTQRRGRKTFATGLAGNFVESLMEYNVAGATPKLFGAVPTAIYDVSAAGAAGAAMLSGLANGRWQHTMFSTAGGSFLVACNGADPVRNYNGTSWTTPSIAGVTPSTLVNVCAHMRRLWFIQQATLKTWYLNVEFIAGAATEINFAPLCELGGELVAMASWTRDGGAGLDDLAVFATSKGQILVYRGTDPSDSDNWGLVGKFRLPEPIGRRCFIKIGADLCYLSSQGVYPLPQALADQTTVPAVTDKISGAFRDIYRSTGTKFGWQVLDYPKENLLIVNVPIVERATQHQYVMHRQTGSWCRFKDINVGCMALKGDALFFGGNDGRTYQYGPSAVYDDDGSPVNAVVVHAFSNFGTGGEKLFQMARPLLAGPTGYVPQASVLTNYNVAIPTFSPAAYEQIGPYWNETPWNSTEWGAGLAVSNRWQTITGNGVVGAIAMASAVTTRLTYNAVDVMFETGSAL